MIQSYSRVRLMSDKFRSQGATLFDMGYNIEVYPDEAYEVESSDADGGTKSQIVAREEDMQLAVEVTEASQHNAPVDALHQ